MNGTETLAAYKAARDELNNARATIGVLADANMQLRETQAELVAALKALSNYVEGLKWGQTWPGRPHAIADAAIAAIARAEGQS